MTQRSVIGIDLGGTNCRGALVPDDGDPVSPVAFKTDIGAGFDRFLRRFISFCRTLMDEGKALGKPVAGLGLGFPGLVSPDGAITVAPNLSPFNGIRLADLLGGELGIPVRVVNDVNAIALGEAHRGAGQAFASFLTLTLGTGVGGGLILERRLWTGADGAAGEIGHMVVKPAGHPCGCGARGCLEQYASATAIVRICRELRLRRDKGAPDVSCPATAEEVAAAALEGCGVAQKTFDIAGRALGQVLAGIANLLNLDGVVIGGGVSHNLELLLPSLHAEIEHRAFGVTARRMQIVKASLGSNGGILGAAQLAREMVARR